jgi:hypothetical protein
MVKAHRRGLQHEMTDAIRNEEHGQREDPSHRTREEQTAEERESAKRRKVFRQRSESQNQTDACEHNRETPSQGANRTNDAAGMG